MVAPHTSEIIAQRLRAQREQRRVTLEQAAAVLRIRLRYVAAMDKGDFSPFPSPAQARGFLRSYAQYLGLDAGPFLAALDGDSSLLEAYEPGLDEETTASQAADSPPPGEEGAGLEEDLALVEDSAQTTQATGDQPGSGGAAEGANAGEAGKRRASRKKRAAASGAAEPRYPRTKFIEIGQTLRSQRETLGLSFGDIERHTRLRAFYLQALEAGDLDSLPSPVQGRGMLKNYASFLGLDAEALLLQFAEGLQDRLAARPGLRILRRSGRATEFVPLGSPQPRLITTDLLLAGVLVVFLLAFIAWGAIRISALRSGQAPTATAPAISDVLAQVGTPTGALAPGDAAANTTPTPASTGELLAAPPEGATLEATATPPPEFSSASVQLIISVRLRTWMRVTVDGVIEFEGRVLPGSAFPFAGNDRVEILTGNGAGLEVNYNQNDMGTLGTFGEAVQRVFTVQGMQTPTATITPTPVPVAITPTLTPTPRP